MASKKKHIIAIDHNKIILPIDLIPEDVTQFSIETLGDGRLILSPILPADQAPQSDKPEGFAEVIDIRLAKKPTPKLEPKKQKQSREKKVEDDFSSEDGFVRLHHFSSRMEAEMFGEILRQAELPFLIQSEDIGIFGPGAAPAPGGAGLVVRRTDLEYAKTLLAGLI